MSIDKQREFTGLTLSLGLTLILTLSFFAMAAGLLFVGMSSRSEIMSVALTVLAVIAGVSGLVMLSGLTTNEPNECRVLTFFGKYAGTFSRTGTFFINPLMTKHRMSLRINNIDIEPIKVNDKIGNPIMIGMVMVWRVTDTYAASFDVDSVGNNRASALREFVMIQGDAALREVAGQYAYDTEHDDNSVTLREGGDVINNLLEEKLNERLKIAGINIVEARINYIAYAPEIAAVMLRRQQASAIISAREKIVEGAVSMVDMALKGLEAQNVVKLDEAQKAKIIGNLLLVLCSEDGPQTVIPATER